MIEMHATKRDGRNALKLSGDLTIYEATEAWQGLQSRLKKHPDLELDLSGLTNLDTAGVQVLFGLKQLAKEQGHGLPMQHHSEAVLEVFNVLNLANEFGDPILVPPSAK